jgi:hypothetical protein
LKISTTQIYKGENHFANHLAFFSKKKLKPRKIILPATNTVLIVKKVNELAQALKGEYGMEPAAAKKHRSV